MNKSFFLTIIIGILMINQVTANVYEFKFTSIDGKIIKLSDFKGKPLVIINTASLCGFTNQYSDIERLFKNYANKDLTVIAVPSYDFRTQELSSHKQVKDFCTTNFNVSFLLTEITNIKGKNGHPFFNWVKKEAGFLAFPKWNFYKYLINREGELVSWYASITKPTDRKIIKNIEKLILDK